MGRLPRKQAQVVLMRLDEEHSFGDIAQAVGCSEATARSHFSKGTQRLRELLSDGSFERNEVPNNEQRKR